jgi:hypothetical protein
LIAEESGIGLVTQARNRLRHYVDAETAFDLLAQATINCGRLVSDTEIEEALKLAYGTSPARKQRGKQAPRFAPDTEWISKTVEREYKMVRTPLKELRGVSRPVPVSADEIMEQIFPGNPLLCVAVSCDSALTSGI